MTTTTERVQVDMWDRLARIEDEARRARLAFEAEMGWTIRDVTDLRAGDVIWHDNTWVQVVHTHTRSDSDHLLRVAAVRDGGFLRWELPSDTACIPTPRVRVQVPEPPDSGF